MPAALTLPRLAWGSPDAPRHALLIHGLGSSGALMWRFGTALADAGWYATAVDLRGHGTAPRALDYTIGAYAADVHGTAPQRRDGGSGWDLVIGHSLGGAAATVASAQDPAWTRRLVLVDPGIHLVDADREAVTASQEQAFADTSQAAVRAEHPHWHPQDIELKSLAAQQASRWAVEQTGAQNTPWDVRDDAARLTVPTHVLGADPAVYSLFTGELAAQVRRNPVVTMSVVAGAGHSPHRDAPEETIRQLFAALG
ncbi:alpha/beta fold hydrolase [Microbacterium sp. PA5]|uniref:alpha/beta fold hydrolase n=1 Tax=Microbacterium sp. PA5 TaxID=3416654 RepID=UPI003CEFB5EB